MTELGLEPYRQRLRTKGSRGRPVGAITMEDRLRRLQMRERAFPEAMRALEYHVQVLNDENELTETRMKAGRFIFEAVFGKPAKAVALETPESTRKEILVRWLPPDPNDTSRVIEPS